MRSIFSLAFILISLGRIGSACELGTFFQMRVGKVDFQTQKGKFSICNVTFLPIDTKIEIAHYLAGTRLSEERNIPLQDPWPEFNNHEIARLKQVPMMSLPAATDIPLPKLDPSLSFVQRSLFFYKLGGLNPLIEFVVIRPETNAQVTLAKSDGDRFELRDDVKAQQILNHINRLCGSYLLETL